MRRFLIPGLLALCWALPVLSAEDPDPEPTGSDAKKLLGDWEVLSMKSAGIERKLPAGIEYSMKIEKDKLTQTMNLRGKTRDVASTYKLASSKSPRQIDWTVTTTKRTSYGIYKLEKGQLTIAYSTAPNTRPKDFKSSPFLMVLRQKKK